MLTTREKKNPAPICKSMEHILGCSPGFSRCCLNQEAPVDRRVHLLFDDRSLRIHLVFASSQSINAANPVRGFGQLHYLLNTSSRGFVLSLSTG